ncbi:ligase-associated DNA damage response endonuclease PdeM [Chryseobacterium sp. TY3]
MMFVEEIVFNDETWILTNQRALYWTSQNAVVLSDLHLGKTAHFRKNGIALPSQLIHKDLERLANMVEYFSASKVFVVGDFLHAGKNSELAHFKNWKQQFPQLEIILIKGNHDRIAEQHLQEIGVTKIHSSYIHKNIQLIHECVSESDFFTISGHIHPGISLRLTTKKHLKLPCFVVQSTGIILPAFSSFTGLDTKEIEGDATFYAFSEEGIFAI